MSQINTKRKPHHSFVGIEKLRQSLVLSNRGCAVTMCMDSELPYIHLRLFNGDKVLEIHEQFFDMMVGYRCENCQNIISLLDDVREDLSGFTGKPIGSPNGFVDSSYRIDANWKDDDISLTFTEILHLFKRNEYKSHTLHVTRDEVELIYKMFVNAKEHLIKSNRVWHEQGCKSKKDMEREE